jgi:hypothetical protein
MGPGTVPPKVQKLNVAPSAISRVSSRTSSVTETRAGLVRPVGGAAMGGTPSCATTSVRDAGSTRSTGAGRASGSTVGAAVEGASSAGAASEHASAPAQSVKMTPSLV